MDICSVNGCERGAYSKGLCTMHYQRQRRGRPMEGPGIAPKDRNRKYAEDATCVVDGCGRPHSSQRGMCDMHYQRWAKHGDPGVNKSKYGQGYITAEGYRVITIAPYKTKLEHRHVVEQAMGRPLEPFENVHHKNGIRADNRLENLEVWTKPQPIGQRPEDLAVWIVEHYPALVAEAQKGKRGDQLHLF